MIKTLIISSVAFAATNIDDLLLNMVFFAACSNRKEKLCVVAGKYLATAILTVAGIAGGVGIQTVAEKYVWLLGLIPLGLGIKERLSAFKDKENENETGMPAGNLVLGTARITIASGADNIGVYIPLFASMALWQMAVTAAVFAVMTGLWCFAAIKMTDLPPLQKILTEHGKLLVPAVYICLGIYILFIA